MQMVGDGLNGTNIQEKNPQIKMILANLQMKVKPC